MNVLYNTSIKNKIIMIVMLVCSLITGLGFSIIMFSDVNHIKKDLLYNTSMNARLIGETCSTSLSFKYPERAQEVLEKLKFMPGILNCYVYDTNSDLFASYNKTGETPVSPSVKKETFHNFEGDYLYVYEPIVFKGNKLGTIYLKTYTSLSREIRNHIILLLSLMFGLLILSYLLANALQKVISGPILKLADTAENVSEKKDYSIRADKENEDEVGKLIDSFNDMLSLIQHRDDALRESEEKFRVLVETSSDIIWELNAEGVYTYVSPQVEKILGYNEEELVGTTPFDLMPQVEKVRLTKIFKDMSAKGEAVVALENVSRHKDGRQVVLETSGVPVLKEDGKVAGYRGVNRDITERKQGEEELLIMKTLSDQTSEVIAIKDKNFKYIIANPVCVDELSKASGQKQIIGNDDYQILPKEIADKLREIDERVLVNDEEVITEELVGEKIYLSRKFPIKDTENNTIAMGLIASDITERKRAERESLILRTAVDQVPVGIALADENLNLYFCNPEGLGLRGGNENDLVEIPKDAFDNWQVLMLNGEPYEIANLPLVRAVTKGLTIKEEFIVRHQDGSDHLCDAIASPIYDDKKIIGGIIIFPDVTERKKAEEKIMAALKEKETLLGEVHHRVKNNMQVIASLLKLQSKNVKDKKYADMFKESRDRIRSMALVHEILYQTESFADIDLKEYVRNLVISLFRSYGARPDKIALKIEVEDVSLELERAIPCGLIINELVSNSLKYAFPENRDGEIRVALYSINEDELVLEVSDNGISISEELDIRNIESMGLYLVTMLSEKQLEGKIELNRVDGTNFHIRFKKRIYKARI